MPFWRTRLKRGYRLKDDSDSVPRASFPALLVSLVLIALLLWWLL
jgi:hypothetical protein